MILSSIWRRVYADFLMPSRLGAYRELLELATRQGYTFHSVQSFHLECQSGSPSLPALILRHDIDSDIATAREIWKIEKSLDVRSSFYFRLSTIDVPLMQSIEATGSEASYHYEELATIAKRRRIRSAGEVESILGEAREMFAHNLLNLRAKTGLPMRTVASHGDFVNRALGVPNHVMLRDLALRKRLDIELETYDHEAMSRVEVRCADVEYPLYWLPSDPEEALRRGTKVVYVLTHPRQWRVARMENLYLLLNRIAEGLSYRWGYAR